MGFPIHRMRRLRATEALRNLVRETRLAPSQFILPLFVCTGEKQPRGLASAESSYLAFLNRRTSGFVRDGRVAALREALDHGFQNTPILSYVAKFASVFYGLFREAAESTPQFGDRRSYLMDPANGREAMREIEEDLEEGADMIMVKPAMPYLD